ncbi:hypothetical protein B0H17DRAFT_1089990 [Mycena rosella]|uniref:Uncharacterized protein n=1 Tax=Mycena rosella TaxID=1033263 RepID=A0AAD7G8I4_MYCRO|nr:hypothetical protein B0H17DRAFT_1089990 [Mycena rosella]
MDIELDPDEFEAYTKRWAFKWHYFQETFPETSQENVEGMGRDEIRARITWLEGDLNRIVERTHQLQEHTTDYEILAGAAFVLIEYCQPDLISVLTGSNANATLTEQTSPELYFLVGQQLKTVANMHMFALRCINEIITMKQTLAARSKLQNSRTSSETKSRSSHSATSPTAPAVETSETNAKSGRSIHFHSIERDSPVAETGTLVSSANSHMKNLTALLGIAFFGASITWSTIFSGTRGNLVLISWAACLFIVGAVAAAAASMLVISDEDIVAVYPPVRWTVRILSILAMIHVLAGIFLVAIATLVLDPQNEDLNSAGGYAISVSTMFVIVAGTV